MIAIVGNPVPSTPQPTWTPSPTPSVVPGTVTIEIPTNAPSPTPSPTLGTPLPSSTSTPNPTQGTGTATHTPTPTATPTRITITASPTPTTTPSAFFEDVPMEHWAYQSIKDLFDGGFIAGCSLEPLLYCPSSGMDRAEASVFITRGVEGAEYHPSTPSTPPYADVFLSDWFVEWVNYIKEAGFTSGCGQNQAGQETFCPTRIHTRAEAATFFVRILEGPEFTPPEPDPQRSFKFDDVAADSSLWYNKWIYYAWDQGIVGDCESPEDLMDNLYRPEEEILREEAACMMAHALGLK